MRLRRLSIAAYFLLFTLPVIFFITASILMVVGAVVWKQQSMPLPSLVVGLILIELCAMIAATGLLLVLSRFFSRPWREMAEKMNEVANNDNGLSQQVEVRSGVPIREFDDVITDFNAMVATLRESLRRRDDLLEVKSQFLSVVTHYCRTPLTIMRWATDAWLTNLKDFKKNYRDEVVQVVEGIKRLNLGFQNLFTAIEIDDQNTRLELKRVRLKGVVEREIREMEPLARLHAVEIEENLLDVGMVPCDPDKLSKVIQIVIANAIFYNHRGGQIDVDLKAEGEMVVLTVKDTGIGISKDDLTRHVFEPFFRADDAKKKFTDGSGLGLYIAKAFINLHGGSIKIQSKPNEGTVVRIFVPMFVRFSQA